MESGLGERKRTDGQTHKQRVDSTPHSQSQSHYEELGFGDGRCKDNHFWMPWTCFSWIKIQKMTNMTGLSTKKKVSYLHFWTSEVKCDDCQWLLNSPGLTLQLERATSKRQLSSSWIYTQNILSTLHNGLRTQTPTTKNMRNSLQRSWCYSSARTVERKTTLNCKSEPRGEPEQLPQSRGGWVTSFPCSYGWCVLENNRRNHIPPSCLGSQGFSDRQKNKDITDKASFLQLNWPQGPSSCRRPNCSFPAATELLINGLCLWAMTPKTHRCNEYTSHW